MMGFLLLLLVLFIVIFIHELGHVVAFRRVGVEIDTMSVGIPWGPRISIKSKFLRRYAGANFTLVLSPLVLGGYVKPDKDEEEDRLSSDEKALVYGGGVIANILLFLFIYSMMVVTVIINFGARDVGVPMLPFLGKHNPWVTLGFVGLLAGNLLYYARFVCRWVFPFIGIAVSVLVALLLWKMLADTALLAKAGFIEIAGQTQSASEAGYFWSYVGSLSFIIGLGNLLPFYPLDGGHIGMIHVRKFTPKLEPYYKRLGMVVVICLLVLQFVPDLYRLLR